MADLDEISLAIGRLQAAFEAHANADETFHERQCKRLEAIEAKIDPLIAYRNKLLGGVAVVATAFSVAGPWIARKLGILP